MKRGAGADIFLKTLDKVRSAVPGIALRTSRSSSGFPVRMSRTPLSSRTSSSEAKFDWLGVFTYSHEEGSAAYAMSEQAAQAHH